ncbi:hypothetical protein JTB14_025103 [Gonioctena quinquepunctata]|nr:hypothetical protein JTB14_025103 [Gonioctena quinquepunctata]
MSNNELYEQLQAFWKIEEVKRKTHYTLEELECEEHYAKTFRRDDQGRFEVTLPVKDELNQWGESKKGAITRLSSIEKRFIRDLEYQRAEWNAEIPESVRTNPLVLLREENLPPMQWRLGRIVAVHPGRDNVVRVVSVLTKNGVVKRSVTKVSALPID